MEYFRANNFIKLPAQFNLPFKLTRSYSFNLFPLCIFIRVGHVRLNITEKSITHISTGIYRRKINLSVVCTHVTCMACINAWKNKIGSRIDLISRFFREPFCRRYVSLFSLFALTVKCVKSEWGGERKERGGEEEELKLQQSFKSCIAVLNTLLSARRDREKSFKNLKVKKRFIEGTFCREQF